MCLQGPVVVLPGGGTGGVASTFTALLMSLSWLFNCETRWSGR